MKLKFKFLFILFIIFSFFYSFKQFKVYAAKKEIVIGLDENLPPMGFKNENNQIVGFDIDLAKEVFKDDYEKVTFQPIDWDSKELELNSGKIDVIWNGLSKTPEREKSMLLTKPYLKNRQVVLVRADSTINSVNDLENKTICVQKGSTGAETLSKHKICSKLKQTIELETIINCLNEVETKKSDAAVVDEVVAKYFLKKLNKNEFKVLDEELSSEFYVVAVKNKNEKLKNLIEEKLNKLYISKKASQISEKWFGEDIFYWQNESLKEDSNKKSLSFLKPMLSGLKQTLILFVLVLIFSLPLGLILFLLLKLKIKIVVKAFVNLMRSTPLLLQILFVFYAIPYLPVVGETLAIKNRFLAGVLTFVLNYSAYFEEIFRGGFLAINKGQIEAAKLLGVGKFKLFFKILLPQVFKITLPSICNETVTLVKDTALVFAIGVPELLSNTKNMVNSTANIMPYFAAFAIYLTICSTIVFVFKKLESKIKF